MLREFSNTDKDLFKCPKCNSKDLELIHDFEMIEEEEVFIEIKFKCRECKTRIHFHYKLQEIFYQEEV